jgi:hypothetical protein
MASVTIIRDAVQRRFKAAPSIAQAAALQIRVVEMASGFFCRPSPTEFAPADWLRLSNPAPSSWGR